LPTLTLTTGTVDALGVARSDLLEPTLGAGAGRVLEALLASRGFDLTSTIHVSELAISECEHVQLKSVNSPSVGSRSGLESLLALAGADVAVTNHVTRRPLRDALGRSAAHWCLSC